MQNPYLLKCIKDICAITKSDEVETERKKILCADVLLSIISQERFCWNQPKGLCREHTGNYSILDQALKQQIFCSFVENIPDCFAVLIAEISCACDFPRINHLNVQTLKRQILIFLMGAFTNHLRIAQQGSCIVAFQFRKKIGFIRPKSAF